MKIIISTGILIAIMIIMVLVIIESVIRMIEKDNQ